MGRHFASYNEADPAPVVALLDQCPPCFDKGTWRTWLLDVHRGTLNDPVNRALLNRGVLPSVCDDCTQGYAQRMQAQGRCVPPRTAAQAVAGDMHVHLGAVARAAAPTSAGFDGPGAKVNPSGSASTGNSRPNAQSESASPMVGMQRPSGLCLQDQGVEA